jgi:hypothetical protein
MEYLHSYSSPINHNQLMKNNKSLTSSPCDDMDKVPIAEQKTKDSVGKENAMNLSDHESCTILIIGYIHYTFTMFIVLQL